MFKQILFIFIFLYSVTLTAQWKRVFLNSNNDLYDIQMINNVGYLLGDNSMIMKTRDSGKSWRNLTLPTNLNGRCLFIVDTSIGFITGENAKILKTTNGGVSWAQKYIQTATYAYGIKFSGNNGICVGKNLLAIRSQDFGETWQSDTTFNSRKQLNSVCILPNGMCWAVGDSGYIIKNNISAKRWTKLPNLTKMSLNHIANMGDSILYISGGFHDTAGGTSTYKNIFLYSKDSGNTWQQTIFSETKIVNKAWYVNKDTAYFVGNGGLVSKSYNILNNRALQLTGTANSLNAISFANSIGMIVGDGGLVLRTTNNGGFRLNTTQSKHENKFVAYPNPSTGLIYLKNENDIQNIQIRNMEGKIVSYNLINKHTIEIQSDGMYFMTITDKNFETQTQKILVLK